MIPGDLYRMQTIVNTEVSHWNNFGRELNIRLKIRRHFWSTSFNLFELRRVLELGLLSLLAIRKDTKP